MSYMSFSQPSSIAQGTTSAGLAYDAYHQRYKMCTPNCTSPTATTYYMKDPMTGMYSERVVSGSTTTWNDYVIVPGAGIVMLDSLCLINMNARLYDPSIGRFMSADSIVPNAMNTQSHNRYTYVTDNPLKATDPTGHSGGGQGDDGDDDNGYNNIIIPCTNYCGPGNPLPEGCGDAACPDGPGGDNWGWGGMGGFGSGMRGEERAGGLGYGNESGGGGGGSGGGSSDKGLVCRLLPDARTVGVNGTIGGITGPTGSFEAVMNYNTGQTTLFVSTGGFVGWNYGAQANVTTGLVWGLGSDNNNYAKGFVSGYGGDVLGGYVQSSIPKLGGATEVGASYGTSLIPGPTGGSSVTYAWPIASSNLPMYASPVDLLISLAKQAACGN